MGPEGFEPSIYSLEGCRLIQARLQARRKDTKEL